MDRVEIITVCGAGVVITFYNKNLLQTHMWIIANPADKDKYVAELKAMPHIEKVEAHGAVVK